MIRLTRYIGGQVMAAILVVLLLIVGFDVIAALVDQFGELRGGYTFANAMIYVGLTIPGRINEYLPMAALVGSLVAMGALSSGSELIVMRASGISIGRLVWYASRPVLVLIVFSLAISEYVSPYTDQWAKSYKDLSRWGSDHSLASSDGLWHREGNRFIHMAVVQPGGVLYGVTFFEFDSTLEMTRAVFADRAIYRGESWQMEDVRITRFGEQSVTSESMLTMNWQSGLTPSLLAYLALSPEDLSLSGLTRYARYLESQELDSGEYWLAFWQKISHPLAVMSLVLIAMSFVFGPLRESTAGYRVFIGVVVGISFQFAQNLLGPSSLIYGFEPLYAVSVPIVLCALLGAVLLSRSG